MALPLLAAGVGLIGSIAGGAMKASAASEAKDAMKRYANRIGLDVGSITDESMSGMQKMFPSATELGSKINAYYSDELNKALEQAYPGYSAQLGKYSSNVGSFMAGELPADVQSQIFRASAGRALMGGYSGGGLHRNLTARDLGTTSLGLQQYGMGLFSQVPSAFPRAGQADITQLLGLTPQQLVNLRQQEQTQKYSMLGASAQMPSSTAVWGDTLTQMGGSMMGMGLESLMSGGTKTTTPNPAALAAGSTAATGIGLGLGSMIGF